MNNEPYGWVKNGEYVLYIEKPDSVFNYIPLYTHSSEHDLGIAEAIGFEKGHKSAEDMLRQQQEEIKDLKQQVAFLEDWRDTWSPFLKAIMGKVNEE